MKSSEFMQKKKIELLAPAGNMDALKAAAAAGCDAVYLGGTNYSARAFAGNFNHEEMDEAIRYAHERGIKVYVTMNTLLFEDEIEQAMKEVDFLYHHDADALLVQDFGLFQRIRQQYPDFDLHCSTQMHIHNVDGVKLMQKYGASRCVLARETPIELIRQCAETGMEIEVFAYGAICISYSGQCLLSQSVKNRSGNRGMCAQMCRLRYYPMNEQGAYRNEDGDYVLSPKDLNLLERIPDLIEAGVSSLKIEGRMKRPEYVYLVTKTFREAIDAFYAGKKWHLSSERERQLKLMFNRGFSQGHAFHNDIAQRMNHYRPNHKGVEIGRVVTFKNGRVLVHLSAPLYQHDGLRILNEPVDTGLTAVKIEKNGLLVNHADAGDDVWLDCHSKPAPKKGQSLQKTSDARLLEEIRKEIDQNPRRSLLHVSYRAEAGFPLHLEAADEDGNLVTTESSFIIEQAQKAPVSKERLEENLSKSDEHPYQIVFDKTQIGTVFLPLSVINETRRKLLDAMSEKRSVRHQRGEGIPYQVHVPFRSDPPFHLIVESEKEIEHLDDTLYVSSENKMPVVREEVLNTDLIEHQIVSEPGDLNYRLKECIAGINLNCANSYALDFLFSTEGIHGVIASSELNDRQIEKMIHAFKERNGWTPMIYKLVYGRRKLMYIRQGFMEKMPLALRDLEGRVYPIESDKNIVNVLESDPVRCENNSGKGSCVILTTESQQVSQQIEREAYEEIHRRV